MKTETVRAQLINLLLTGLLFAFAACSSSTDSGPDCRFNQAWLDGQCRIDIDIPVITLSDGIWRGADSAGRDVVIYIDRFHSFQFLDGSGNQGTGLISIGEGDVVASRFRLVTPRGEKFSDGTTTADCTFSGTVITEQVLTVIEDCTTSLGMSFREELRLTFDALYNRPSSLALVAGMYDTPTSNVLDVAADGSLFSQDGTTGCMTIGQIDVTVSFKNMYFYEFGIDNCIGADAVWNGSSFSGLAVLDDTLSPETLTIAATGAVEGISISLFIKNERL